MKQRKALVLVVVLIGAAACFWLLNQRRITLANTDSHSPGWGRPPAVLSAPSPEQPPEKGQGWADFTSAGAETKNLYPYHLLYHHYAPTSAQKLAAKSRLDDGLAGLLMFDPLGGSPAQWMPAIGKPSILEEAIGQPDEVAMLVIRKNSELFLHGADELKNARLRFDRQLGSSKQRTVEWEQTFAGLPVIDATIRMELTPGQGVTAFADHFLASPDRKAGNAIALPSEVPDRTPKITSEAAIRGAATSVGESNVRMPVRPDEMDEKARADLQTVVRLGWLADVDQGVRLCWDTAFESKSNTQVYRCIVDAKTGDVLIRRELGCTFDFTALAVNAQPDDSLRVDKNLIALYGTNVPSGTTAQIWSETKDGNNTSTEDFLRLSNETLGPLEKGKCAGAPADMVPIGGFTRYAQLTPDSAAVSLANTTGIVPGVLVWGPGVPLGATVTSVTGAGVTLSMPSTVTVATPSAVLQFGKPAVMLQGVRLAAGATTAIVGSGVTGLQAGMRVFLPYIPGPTLITYVDAAISSITLNTANTLAGGKVAGLNGFAQWPQVFAEYAIPATLGATANAANSVTLTGSVASAISVANVGWNVYGAGFPKGTLIKAVSTAAGTTTVTLSDFSSAHPASSVEFVMRPSNLRLVVLDDNTNDPSWNNYIYGITHLDATLVSSTQATVQAGVIHSLALGWRVFGGGFPRYATISAIDSATNTITFSQPNQASTGSVHFYLKGGGGYVLTGTVTDATHVTIDTSLMDPLPPLNVGNFYSDYYVRGGGFPLGTRLAAAPAVSGTQMTLTLNQATTAVVGSIIDFGLSQWVGSHMQDERYVGPNSAVANNDAWGAFVAGAFGRAVPSDPVTTPTPIAIKPAEWDDSATIAITGTLTAGSANVTDVMSSVALEKGLAVSGPGIPADCYIISVTSGTAFTLSSPATASGTGTQILGTMRASAPSFVNPYSYSAMPTPLPPPRWSYLNQANTWLTSSGSGVSSVGDAFDSRTSLGANVIMGSYNPLTTEQGAATQAHYICNWVASRSLNFSELDTRNVAWHGAGAGIAPLAEDRRIIVNVGTTAPARPQDYNVGAFLPQVTWASDSLAAPTISATARAKQTTPAEAPLPVGSYYLMAVALDASSNTSAPSNLGNANITVSNSQVISVSITGPSAGASSYAIYAGTTNTPGSLYWQGTTTSTTYTFQGPVKTSTSTIVALGRANARTHTDDEIKQAHPEYDPADTVHHYSQAEFFDDESPAVNSTTRRVAGSIVLGQFNLTSPSRRSALDPSVVVHEWGHAVTSRLCWGGFGPRVYYPLPDYAPDRVVEMEDGRAISEGSSDFIALMMLTPRPSAGTDLVSYLKGKFPIGTYVSGRAEGIRRFAYSGNRAVSPLTAFNHNSPKHTWALTWKWVQDPALANTWHKESIEIRGYEPHAYGELWCAALWDVFINLANQYGWDEAKMKMMDLFSQSISVAGSDSGYDGNPMANVVFNFVSKAHGFGDPKFELAVVDGFAGRGLWKALSSEATVSRGFVSSADILTPGEITQAGASIHNEELVGSALHPFRFVVKGGTEILDQRSTVKLVIGSTALICPTTFTPRNDWKGQRETVVTAQVPSAAEATTYTLQLDAQGGSSLKWSANWQCRILPSLDAVIVSSNAAGEAVAKVYGQNLRSSNGMWLGFNIDETSTVFQDAYKIEGSETWNGTLPLTGRLTNNGNPLDAQTILVGWNVRAGSEGSGDSFLTQNSSGTETLSNAVPVQLIGTGIAYVTAVTSAAAIGDTIEITGAGFNSPMVKFNTVSASASSVTNTTIRVTIPQNAALTSLAPGSLVQVTVQQSGLTDTNHHFTLLPKITADATAPLTPGSSLTITGTNFGDLQTGIVFYLDDVSLPSVGNGSSRTVLIPTTLADGKHTLSMLDQNGVLLGTWSQPVTIRSTPVAVTVPKIQANWQTFAGVAGRQGMQDGPAVEGRYNLPTGVAYYAPTGITASLTSGLVYVADKANHVIRQMTCSDGSVVTLAGTPGIAGSAPVIGSSSWANSAQFNSPSGVAVATVTAAGVAAGSVFVTDTENNAVRMISPAGKVTTIQTLNQPTGIAIDPATNTLYVADAAPGVWKLTPGTSWTKTQLGTGIFVTPRAIAFDAAVAAPGVVYVADAKTATATDLNAATGSIINGVIRKVTVSTGAVSTVSITGTTTAVKNPTGIAIVGTTLYVTEAYQNTPATTADSHRVVKIPAAGGALTAWLGTTGTAALGYTDATTTLARFNQLRGVCPVGNVGFILSNGSSDSRYHTVRTVTTAGAVATLSGRPASPGIATAGTATSYVANTTPRFGSPSGMACAPTPLNTDYIYLADPDNNNVRVQASDPSGNGNIKSLNIATGLGAPQGVSISAFNTSGYPSELLMAEAGTHIIRKMTVASNGLAGSGAPVLVAGTSGISGSADISTTSTTQKGSFNGPTAVVKAPNGIIYVSDTGNHTIRSVTVSGTTTTVTTVAGSAGIAGSADTQDLSGSGFTGPDAIPSADNEFGSLVDIPLGLLSSPHGIVYGGTKNTSTTILYVADTGNHSIRRIEVTGANSTISTIAGFAGIAGEVDGFGQVAKFCNPTGLAIFLGAANQPSYLFVTDVGGSTTSGQTVRRITLPAGFDPAATTNNTCTVETIGGQVGVDGWAAGLTKASQFNNPAGVCVAGTASSTLRVYVADTDNNRLAKGVLGTPPIVQDLTSLPPMITTSGSLNVATLSGWVDTNSGGNATWQFSYGKTAKYDNTTTATSITSAGQVSTSTSTGLELDTLYHYRLSAWNSSGQAYTDDGVFSTPVTWSPLPPVISGTITEISTGTTVLTVALSLAYQTTPANAVTEIWRSSDGVTFNPAPEITLPVSQTSWSQSVPTGTYYYKARLISGSYTTPWSNTVTITPPPTGSVWTTASPTLTTMSDSQVRVVLTFAASSGYQDATIDIQRRPSGAGTSYTLVASNLAIESTTFTDDIAVDPDINPTGNYFIYQYRISAGLVVGSWQNTTGTPSLPNRASASAAATSLSGAVKLQVTSASPYQFGRGNAVTYPIDRSADNGTTWTPVASALAYSADNRTAYDYSLNQPGTYWYRIRVKNDGNDTWNPVPITVTVSHTANNAFECKPFMVSQQAVGFRLPTGLTMSPEVQRTVDSGSPSRITLQNLVEVGSLVDGFVPNEPLPYGQLNYQVGLSSASLVDASTSPDPNGQPFVKSVGVPFTMSEPVVTVGTLDSGGSSFTLKEQSATYALSITTVQRSTNGATPVNVTLIAVVPFYSSGFSYRGYYDPSPPTGTNVYAVTISNSRGWSRTISGLTVGSQSAYQQPSATASISGMSFSSGAANGGPDFITFNISASTTLAGANFYVTLQEARLDAQGTYSAWGYPSVTSGSVGAYFSSLAPFSDSYAGSDYGSSDYLFRPVVYAYSATGVFMGLRIFPSVSAVTGAVQTMPALPQPSVRTVPLNIPLTGATFRPAGSPASRKFRVASGTVPLGLFVTPTGDLSGTPTQPGTYSFSVEAEDLNGAIGSSGVYTIFVRFPPTPYTTSFTVTGGRVADDASASGSSVTLLADGKVLSVGGQATVGYTASAEIYDPSTGIWSITGSLNFARAYHTATLLADGKVMVVGGVGATGVTDSVEIFDPASGTWATNISYKLNQKRYFHSATLLDSGKVIVIEGIGVSGSPVMRKDFEVYDPSTGLWTLTTFNSDSQGRCNHTATKLNDGKVLIVGGLDSAHLSSASAAALKTAIIYNPYSNAFSLAASCKSKRVGHTATLLANPQSSSLLNGKVLVVGGCPTYYSLQAQEDAATEFYDPAANSWSILADPLSGDRFGHSATLLPNGLVLLASGWLGSSGGEVTDLEIYDPVVTSWQPAGTMPASMWDNGFSNTVVPRHFAIPLGGGQVLLLFNGVSYIFQGP